jgi:transcriptional regulator with XRE-family HTH domain
MSTAESERLISLLKSAIRLSNYSYRDIERQLGWRVGTITRLMRGGLGLKIEHLLSILRVIDFSPSRFFAAAYPTTEPAGPEEDRLFRLLEQMYGDPEALRAATARRGGAANQDEIDEMVRVSLRKLIGARGEAAGEPEA